MSDPARLSLRHTLATLAYRGGKAVRDVPETVASFKAGVAAGVLLTSPSLCPRFLC